MAQIQQVIGTLIGGGDVIYMDSVGLVVQGHAAAHHRPQAAALEILQDAAVDLLLKVDHANGCIRLTKFRTVSGDWGL